MGAVSHTPLAFRVLAFTIKNIYITWASIPNYEFKSATIQ